MDRSARIRVGADPEDECLNEDFFANLAEARAVAALWRRDYKHVRPHSALGGLTPAVRLTPAAGRLHGCGGPAARPLPPATEISYEGPGLPYDRRTQGGQVIGPHTLGRIDNLAGVIPRRELERRRFLDRLRPL